MKNNNAEGMAFVCDKYGNITKVLYNNTGITIDRGSPFPYIVNNNNFSKALTFLENLKSSKVALDWEFDIMNPMTGENKIYDFEGCVMDNNMIIIGTARSENITRYYENMMKINNEQLNMLRLKIKESSKNNSDLNKKSLDEELFNEITKLNNELANSKRELMKKNIEIERTMEKLKHSNQELNQFASIVAHDLKNPIIAIISALSLIKRKLSEQEKAELSEVFQETHRRSQNLLDMIDYLLDYARFGSNTDFEILDTEELLKDAIDNLSDKINDTNAQITYDSLPKLKCNRYQMISLFQNLIENSIKYKAKDRNPKIYIKAEKGKKDGNNSNAWVFSIEDNGIGIKDKHKKDIFDIFKRANHEVEGTGIGLAYCKKIVNIHGGDIFVDSEYGKGTKFVFTLK